jgi:hypothetical protein
MLAGVKYAEPFVQKGLVDDLTALPVNIRLGSLYRSCHPERGRAPARILQRGKPESKDLGFVSRGDGHRFERSYSFSATATPSLSGRMVVNSSFEP